jgi:adenylate cyclase
MQEERPGYQLVFVSGPCRGDKYELSEDAESIGRDHELCSVRLSPDDSTSSRIHAVIRFEDGKYLIENKSKNKTFINDKEVDLLELTPGDKIRIGQNEILFAKANLHFQIMSPSESFILESGPVKDVDGIIDTRSLKSSQEQYASAAENLVKKDMARFRTVMKIANEIGSVLDFNELYEIVLVEIFKVLNPDRAFIISMPEDEMEMVPQIVVKKNDDLVLRNVRASQSLLRKVFLERKAFLYQDIGQDVDLGRAASLMEVRSVICVPVMWKNRMLGIVQIDTASAKQFTSDDLEFMTAIATQLGAAMENVRLLDRAKNEARTRDNLSRFLSKELVGRIMRNEVQLSSGGELTDATVMFVDIRSFTTLSDEMGPARTVEFLNEFFPVVTGSIFKYKGTVDKFIGDAVMATWGATVKNPRHASAAVQCGLDILNEVSKKRAAWKKEFNVEVRAGISINTGEVTVGCIGTAERMEYTVIGDPVNIASRIESLNRDHNTELLISGGTYEKIKEEYETKKLGRFKIRGKQAEMDVYEVIGVKGFFN